MKKLIYFCLLAAGAMVAACSGPDMDSHAQASFFGSVPAQGWLYSMPLEFSADSLPDSTVSGPLVLTVRHAADYPYRNVWLEVEQARVEQIADTSAENGVRQVRHERRDTFELMLADPFGRWYGRGMGASMRLCDTVAPSYALRRGAKLNIRHIMRADTLPGIEQVGFLIL